MTLLQIYCYKILLSFLKHRIKENSETTPGKVLCRVNQRTHSGQKRSSSFQVVSPERTAGPATRHRHSPSTWEKCTDRCSENIIRGLCVTCLQQIRA